MLFAGDFGLIAISSNIIFLIVLVKMLSLGVIAFLGRFKLHVFLSTPKFRWLIRRIGYHQLHLISRLMLMLGSLNPVFFRLLQLRGIVQAIVMDGKFGVFVAVQLQLLEGIRMAPESWLAAGGP